jgi:hypothetical protein
MAAVDERTNVTEHTECDSTSWSSCNPTLAPRMCGTHPSDSGLFGLLGDNRSDKQRLLYFPGLVMP